MRTAEEIAIHFGLCTCGEEYKSRNLSAPDCPWHSMSVEEAMKEYAKEACEQQKRICRLETKIEIKGSFMAGIDEQSILNAPLPELK